MQPKQADCSPIQESADAGDRRTGQRTITIYRLVRVITDHDEGLARCRNISDTGARIDLTMEVAQGEEIEIAFSSSVTLRGKVVWVDGVKCGIQFDNPVDSSVLLAGTSSETRAARSRPPRLKFGAAGRLRHGHVTQPVVIEDISQHGMKLSCEEDLRPGLEVVVALGEDLERDGVIRWVRDGVAGMMLLQPFSVDELGSVRAIGATEETTRRAN